MPSRTRESQIATYTTTIKLPKQRSFTQKLATLDNETSDLLLQSLKNADLSINLVPPNIHRRNTAERAIQTFKAHFISILCGTHPKSPLNMWDKLLLQAKITRISYATHVSILCYWRIVKFEVTSTLTTPPSPLGTNLLVHIKPEVRES